MVRTIKKQKIMYASKILSVGYYVPDNVVTNNDLAEVMDTSDAWIIERTGIHERRHIKPGDGNSTSVMGVKAAKNALKNAGMDADEIDMIVFATLSPTLYFPGGGVEVQEMLMKRTIPALDVRNQCSGFVYGLSVADQFIKTGMYKNVLVIGSENHSGGLDMTTRGRGVSVIFGDGAGAVVLSRAEEGETSRILSTHLHSQGEHKRELVLEGPSTQFWVPEIIDKNPQEDIPYYRNKYIGFIFQSFQLLPRLTAAQNVELPLIYSGINSNRRKEIARDILSKVGLGDKINNFPTQLSGGQQQRVAIARAISTEPSILLADEPTGALDQETGIKILEFFKELHDEGRTIIMITHDRSIAQYGDRIVNIIDGKMSESGELYDKR